MTALRPYKFQRFETTDDLKKLKIIIDVRIGKDKVTYEMLDVESETSKDINQEQLLDVYNKKLIKWIK